MWLSSKRIYPLSLFFGLFGQTLHLFLLFSFNGNTAFSATNTTNQIKIPDEVLTTLRDLPPRKPGETIGEIFLCDPYCESQGQITSANKQLIPEGFKIELTPSPLKSEKKGKSNSALIRVLIDPVRKAEMMPTQTHEGEAIENWDSSQSQEESSKSYGRSHWNIGLMLASSFGARTLSTDANTDTESDAKSHLQYGAHLILTNKNITVLKQGYVSGKMDIFYFSSLSESPKDPTITRKSTTTQIGSTFSAEWKTSNSPWKLAFLLEPRYISYKTEPETSSGFPTNSTFFSPGFEIFYRMTSIRILKSLASSIQDNGNYRGENTTGSLLQLGARSCLELGRVIGGYFTFCGTLNKDTLSIQGAGTPIRTVFTENGKYDYDSLRFGIEFGITEFAL